MADEENGEEHEDDEFQHILAKTKFVPFLAKTSPAQSLAPSARKFAPVQKQDKKHGTTHAKVRPALTNTHNDSPGKRKTSASATSVDEANSVASRIDPVPRYVPPNPLLVLKKLKGSPSPRKVDYAAELKTDIEDIEDVDEEQEEDEQEEDGSEDAKESLENLEPPTAPTIADFINGRADFNEYATKILANTPTKSDKTAPSGHWRTVKSKDGATTKKVFASPSGKAIRGRGGYASYLRSKNSTARRKK